MPILSTKLAAGLQELNLYLWLHPEVNLSLITKHVLQSQYSVESELSVLSFKIGFTIPASGVITV